MSDKHELKNRPPEYIEGFAKAALRTYKAGQLLDQLQHKFFIPDDTQFTEDAYLQSASELTVASYVRGRGVSDFDAEKKVNASNNKDVDVYYRIGSTRVCLEVKCPLEEPRVSAQETAPCGRDRPDRSFVCVRGTHRPKVEFVDDKSCQIR